jgi:hypothetical protein
MKRNEIITNVIIIPLVLGVVFSIAFFLFFNANSDIVLPVSQGTSFAYHDEHSNGSDVVDKSSVDEFSSNDNIGSLTIGDVSLTVKYNADYSNNLGCVSLEDNGSALGEIGCSYLSAYAGDIKGIDTDKTLNINSVLGDYQYKYVDEYSADNEYELLSNSPKIEKGLVIYYQQSNGAGLSSKYKALVFEEVA